VTNIIILEVFVVDRAIGQTICYLYRELKRLLGIVEHGNGGDDPCLSTSTTSVNAAAVKHVETAPCVIPKRAIVAADVQHDITGPLATQLAEEHAQSPFA
jgi:hypothetical protein